EDQIVQIQLGTPLHLRQLNRLSSGKDYIEIGEQSHNQKKHGPYGIHQGRDEIRTKLFCNDRLNGCHTGWPADSVEATTASCARPSSCLVNLRKTSSNVMHIALYSRRPHPLATARRATSSRTSRPSSHSNRKVPEAPLK